MVAERCTLYKVFLDGKRWPDFMPPSLFSDSSKMQISAVEQQEWSSLSDRALPRYAYQQIALPPGTCLLVTCRHDGLQSRKGAGL